MGSCARLAAVGSVRRCRNPSARVAKPLAAASVMSRLVWRGLKLRAVQMRRSRQLVGLVHFGKGDGVRGAGVAGELGVDADAEAVGHDQDGRLDRPGCG